MPSPRTTKSPLQKKLALLTEHQHQLQTQNAELRHALAQAERLVRQQALEALQPAPAAAEPVPEPVLQLHAKKVVCVGGRHTNVANYRAVIGAGRWPVCPPRWRH